MPCSFHGTRTIGTVGVAGHRVQQRSIAWS